MTLHELFGNQDSLESCELLKLVICLSPSFTKQQTSISGISPSLILPCSLLLLVLLERSEHILTQTQPPVFERRVLCNTFVLFHLLLGLKFL